MASRLVLVGGIKSVAPEVIFVLKEVVLRIGKLGLISNKPKQWLISNADKFQVNRKYIPVVCKSSH